MQESARYPFNIFLTLTYDDDHLLNNPTRTLIKRDVQLFLKRLRKALAPRKIRFFASGEYGEKYSRPHYHLILFNVSPLDKPVIESCWRNGFIYIGSVTADSASYVAKYAVKKLNGKMKSYYEEKKIIPEFALMSRRPGIGENYLEYSDYIKAHNFVIQKGHKMAVPKYYEDKIYPSGSEERKIHQEQKNQARLDRLGMSEFKEWQFNRSDLCRQKREQANINQSRKFNLKKGVLNAS